MNEDVVTIYGLYTHKFPEWIVSIGPVWQLGGGESRVISASSS